MSSTGFGFYTDALKTITIIESKGVFASQENRKDLFHGGNYNLSDGTLETYEIYNKFGATLQLQNVKQDVRDALLVEYELHRAFYFFPDVVNKPTEYHQVKWTGPYNEVPNKNEERYSISIPLKEV